MYGRQTETAIAAVSRLSEVYDGGATRLSASEIARDRGLQAPSVAKILTTLSQAGLVGGMPGPGGGYALARDPSEITVRDVFALFEREDDNNNWVWFFALLAILVAGVAVVFSLLGRGSSRSTASE